MRKKLWLLSLTAIFTIGLLTGCDDDDNSTSTSPTMFDGFVTASVYLEPNVYMGDMMIHGIGAVPPKIDSVRVGDSLLAGDDYLDYDYDEDYHDSYWEIYFSENGSSSTYMYSHGDMATISIYGPGGSAMTTLKILDADSASANITSPMHNADTIMHGDTEMIYWNKAADADYYAIMLGFEDFGPVGDNYQFYATADTMFSVTPAMYTDSLYRFWISVVPFNGPNPMTGESNVSGDWLTGKIYSHGWDDWIYVHAKDTTSSGGSGSVSMSKAVEAGERPTELTAEQIVSEIYRRNR